KILFIGDGIHPAFESHAVRIPAAAVENQYHRRGCPLFIALGHIELVVAVATAMLEPAAVFPCAVISWLFQPEERHTIVIVDKSARRTGRQALLRSGERHTRNKTRNETGSFDYPHAAQITLSIICDEIFRKFLKPVA